MSNVFVVKNGFIFLCCSELKRGVMEGNDMGGKHETGNPFDNESGKTSAANTMAADFFRNYDLGDGGDSIAPARNIKTALKAKLQASRRSGQKER